MNARTVSQGNPQTAPPRFDRKFIEDHRLVESYLKNKLPFKGARDLENWCRAHPDYLTELQLSERAQTSLKLLEASGQPVDFREPQPPWWKTIYVLIGLCVVSALSLIAFWVLLGKYVLQRGELDVHIDLGYTDKLVQFRLFVDKKDQGRALVLNNLLKDSNGELRMTLNSTGLAAGIYKVRIEALPFRGSPIPIGWLLLDVR
jgi:hypothetical protein